MRAILLLAATMVLVVPSLAVADAPAAPPARATTPRGDSELQLALAVNAPHRFVDGVARAGSLGIGFATHHAIRANVAAYDYTTGFAAELVAASQGVGIESDYRGRTLDLGIGYQYFPRRLWSGVVLEAGLLHRTIDHTDDETFWNNRVEHREASAVAVRGLIGWSWLLGGHVFVAAAVGLSVGRESGTRTVEHNDGISMVLDETTERYTRTQPAAEGYLRIGVAFGG